MKRILLIVMAFISVHAQDISDWSSINRLMPLATKNEEPKNFSTIFCHGLDAGPLQAAKYIKEHVTSQTGEKIISPQAIEILHAPITAPCMSEIMLRDLKKDNYRSLSAVWKQSVAAVVAYLRKKQFGIKVERNSANPITLDGHGLNVFANNIGQQADQEKLKTAYDNHVMQYPEHTRIMYGCSRGAAATFSFICLNKPAIKAAILEGCFDSVPGVIEQRFKWIVGKKGLPFVETLLTKLTSWNKAGIEPIKVAHQWPAEVPVLFITSHKDKEVPIACTKNLINELKKQVPQAKVYLLELQHSSHPRYAFDHPEDRIMYENVVHAFYQKYGITCDEAKAAAGAQFLQEYQDIN
jgi:hypothetical protein